MAIGIDLGRTKARVGLLCQDGRVEMVPANVQGKRTIPCYVAFTENEVLIGESARYQAAMNPANTIYDIKRLIGRKFSDPSVQEDMKSWPFKVIRGTDDVPMIVVSHAHKIKKFFAVKILSMFLKNLKDVAEDYIRCTVEDAVITVPPEFYNSQRQAVKEAGKVAGLNVLQIISEPVAAAYALHKRIDITRETNVLIFDLGRTTLVVSLLGIDNNGKLEVKAFIGDSQLGGENIDTTVLDHLLKRSNNEYTSDRRLSIRYMSYIKNRIPANSYASSHLRGLCKKAKKRLSSNTEALINDDPINDDPNKPLIPRLRLGRLTREEFEDLNENFFSECIKTVEKCLLDARIKKEDVEAVVLVGGSTRIPKVRQLLQNFFNGKKLCSMNDPREVVAIGAAVVAEKLSHEKRQRAKNLVLLDTIPLSLGVDAHDGTFSVIVPRNTPIPTKKERLYFTTKDDQESISFNVYQGERSKAEGNHLLGKFEVAVPLAPKGKSKVKVVFIIDADGILNCWVKELMTGLKKKIIIDNEKRWISKEKIEKILKDAENYKVEDQRYKKKVFARNALEEYVYNVKRKLKTIRSNNKMIRQNEDMKQMENAIEGTSQYLDRNELADIDEYQNKLNQLEKLCVPIIAQFCNQHSFVVPLKRWHRGQILAPCHLFTLYVIYLLMLHLGQVG